MSDLNTPAVLHVARSADVLIGDAWDRAEPAVRAAFERLTTCMRESACAVYVTNYDEVPADLLHALLAIKSKEPQL